MKEHCWCMHRQTSMCNVWYETPGVFHELPRRVKNVKNLFFLLFFSHWVLFSVLPLSCVVSPRRRVEILHNGPAQVHNDFCGNRLFFMSCLSFSWPTADEEVRRAGTPCWWPLTWAFKESEAWKGASLQYNPFQDIYCLFERSPKSDLWHLKSAESIKVIVHLQNTRVPCVKNKPWLIAVTFLILTRGFSI